MSTAIAEAGKAFRFTPQTAKKAQAASVEARKNAANFSQFPAQSGFATAIDPARAERLMRQMNAMERQMEGLTSTGKLLQIAIAYGKIFSAWQTLVGLEKPATRKRGRERGMWSAPIELLESSSNGHVSTPQPLVSPADLPGNNQVV
jgi:hypothetical protein